MQLTERHASLVTKVPRNLSGNDLDPLGKGSVSFSTRRARRTNRLGHGAGISLPEWIALEKSRVSYQGIGAGTSISI